nr:40S ribosomal protein S13 [Tanacetum cinerariifolium]
MPIDECSCHNSTAADEGEKLDSIKGSNKTLESPSDVLGKRKRTGEGDGAAASKIIPPELHLVIKDALELRQHMMLNKINPDVKNVLKGKNDSESKGGVSCITCVSCLYFNF